MLGHSPSGITDSSTLLCTSKVHPTLRVRLKEPTVMLALEVVHMPRPLSFPVLRPQETPIGSSDSALNSTRRGLGNSCEGSCGGQMGGSMVD